MDEAAALEKFQQAYRGTGLEVRFYPAALTCWRWQIGRNGDSEHFELLAYASTPEGLLEAITARCQHQGKGKGQR